MSLSLSFFRVLPRLPEQDLVVDDGPQDGVSDRSTAFDGEDGVLSGSREFVEGVKTRDRDQDRGQNRCTFRRSSEPGAQSREGDISGDEGL